MQTSRFQLGLLTAMAVSLGFSLASSPAIGYPAGAAVSLGENPVWTRGGQIYGGGAVSIFEATPGRGEMILTDLSISTDYDYDVSISLKLDDGTTLGYWVINGMRAGSHPGTPANIAMNSGIRIPEGRTVLLDPAGVTVGYSFSGYYAHP